jgi:predicted MFS family arabinose efflux permease
MRVIPEEGALEHKSELPPIAAMPGENPWRVRYTVLVLMLVAFISYVDRQVLSILIVPIEKDLRISDTQMGVLTGIFFSGFYALAGIPLARLSDNGNRRNMIGACIAFWSVATALCGSVQSFLQLATARAFVSVGEAGSAPASSSIVADIVSPRRRTRVYGLISAGNAAGLAFGVFLGGVLTHALGWRQVFLVVSLPGLLISLLIFLTVREPLRTGSLAREAGHGLLQTFKALWALPSYRALLALTVLASIGVFSVLGWMPTFLIRVHQMSHAEVGLKMGVAIMVGLLCGNISSGFVTDWLSTRDVRWLSWVSAIGLFAAFPFGMASLFWGTASGSVLLLGFFMFFQGFWAPPTVTLVVGLVDSRSRALASSTLTLVQAIGGAIGPFLVGALNDHLNASYGSQAIRYSLSVALLGCLLGSASAFVGARFVRRDYRAG